MEEREMEKGMGVGVGCVLKNEKEFCEERRRETAQLWQRLC